MNESFWEYLQRLVDTSEIVIDRQAGSMHPRYPDGEYPVDYGFLGGTMAMDAEEWISGSAAWVTKRLLGCLELWIY